MIVEAAHPAAVAVVPRRARKERMGMALCTTPVSLREVPADALSPVGDLFADRPDYAKAPMATYDGQLWSPLGMGLGVTGTRPAALDEARDFLAGRLEGDFAKVLQRQFVGTPLLATDSDRQTEHYRSGTATRGEPIDMEGAKSIGLDDRGLAARDVSAFVEANLLVAGGRPYVRRYPMVHVSGVMEEASLAILDGAGSFGSIGYRTMVATPDTFEAVAEAMGGLGVTVREDARTSLWRRMVPDGAVAGDDARLVVNGFAGAVRHSLDEALGYVHRPQAREELHLARDGLLRMEIRALTGMAHDEGVDVGLARIERGLDAFVRHRSRVGDHGHAFLLAYVRDVLRPSFDRSIAEDAEELTALAL